MSLIRVDNLSYTIWTNTLFTWVSFSIGENQVVSVIWYNGSWKSTLLKLLLGSVSPTQGTIVKKPWVRLWYVPQKLSFTQKIPLTVRDLITIYNGKQSTPPAWSCSLLSIDGLRDKPVWWLSWGQLQKVLIYNALLWNPQILLLDEPTAWLDITAQKEFYTLIDHIQHEHNISIVLVSHDIHTVYKNADTVVCLHQGACCTGSPDDAQFSQEVKDLLWWYVVPYLHAHPHSHDS